VVGGDPQDIKYKGEDTNLVIGDRSRICEFVTINRGTGIGGGTTSIGSDNLIMAYVHIAHDCQVGNNVIITNNSQLAGHVHIEDQAWISGACLLHHFVTVGTLSFVAPCSGVRTDIPPYMVADGYNQDVAKVRNINLEGLRRHQVPEESIKSLKAAFRLVYRGKRTREEALRELADLEIAQDPFVRAFFDHLTASHAGYQNRALERYRTDKTRKLLRVEEE
jgi:UDP-N-acetylglucosamine acyltransferase